VPCMGEVSCAYRTSVERPEQKRPLQCWYLRTRPHSISTQNTNIDIFIAVRTTNLKSNVDQVFSNLEMIRCFDFPNTEKCFASRGY
jgi:hypothetical protein